jgi:acyl-CoA thioester hydrolase
MLGKTAVAKEHRCEIKVRTYELDGYGHVNNAVYLNYLEYARSAFLSSIGFDYSASVKAGIGLYISRIAIDYRSPSFTGDDLTIVTVPVKKRAACVNLSQVIMRGDTLIAEAEVVWAFVNEKGYPARLPERFDLPGFLPPNGKAFDKN